ncbi:MAG TPA: hypothetical protein VGD08_02150 [Stellaceae bacterium]
MPFLTVRPDAAEARTRVSVGIGIGAPIYGPSYGYYGYGPYRYWGPPAYYYGPPPVVYAPPPPTVVYAPPSAPVAAAPVSPPYVARDGQTCREYQTQVTVDGRLQPSHGTACLQPDGTWRLMN